MSKKRLMDSLPKTKREEEVEELVSIIQMVLPPLVRANWSSFRLDAQNCTFRACWDKDCEEIVFSGTIHP